MGFDISPMCDRLSASIEKTQASAIAIQLCTYIYTYIKSDLFHQNLD